MSQSFLGRGWEVGENGQLSHFSASQIFLKFLKNSNVNTNAFCLETLMKCLCIRLSFTPDNYEFIYFCKS